MKLFIRLSTVLVCLWVSPLAHASGAIKTDILGLPLQWDASETVVYNPDSGVLKSTNPLYDTQAKTQDLLRDAFEAWSLLPGIQLGVTQGDLLLVLDGNGNPANDQDVGPFSFEQFLGTGTEACYENFFGASGEPCWSPIIFDEDGEIIDSLFGKCARFSILGFAGFDDVDDGSGNPDRRIVRRSQALFSGACLNPPEMDSSCNPSKPGISPCERVLTDQEIRTIITHEVGHLMGMDHSQLNPEVFTQCSLEQNPGCPAGLSEGLPTMFPILVEGANMATLHRDDEVYFQRLYGDGSDQTCSVSGTVYASDGSTEVRGIEVVAINTEAGSDLTDRISFVSGAEAPKVNNFSRSQGNCKSDCGFYRFTGLSPAQTYRICVQKIDPEFTGGSSIEPVDPPFQLFTPTCPEKLVIPCECNDGECLEIKGLDIITDTDPNDVEQGLDDPSQIQDGVPESGGCTLRN